MIKVGVWFSMGKCACIDWVQNLLRKLSPVLHSTFHLDTANIREKRVSQILQTLKILLENIMNILISLTWKLWNAQIPRKTCSQSWYRNYEYSSMYSLNKLNLQFQGLPLKNNNNKLGWDDFTIKSSKHLKKSTNLPQILPENIKREITSQLILQGQQNLDTKAWEENYEKRKMHINLSCDYKCKKS